MYSAVRKRNIAAQQKSGKMPKDSRYTLNSIYFYSSDLNTA